MLDLSHILLEKIRDGGHDQIISNSGRFKPAFAERDKKPIMIDLRELKKLA